MNKTELKYQVMKTGSYFFDYSSMRFFGDTMANYYVPVNTVQVETWTDGTHECYELRRIRPVKHGLRKSTYFDINTFDRILPRRES